MNDVRDERFIQFPGFLFEHAGFNLDAGRAQHPTPAPLTSGFGIRHRRDDSRHAGLYQGLGARPGPAMVRARFEVGIDRGAARGVAGLLEREDFRVPNAVVGVRAFADDLPVLDDDGAYHDAGAGEPAALLREFKRASNVGLVVHGYRTRFKKFRNFGILEFEMWIGRYTAAQI